MTNEPTLSEDSPGSSPAPGLRGRYSAAKLVAKQCWGDIRNPITWTAASFSVSPELLLVAASAVTKRNRAVAYKTRPEDKQVDVFVAWPSVAKDDLENVKAGLEEELLLATKQITTVTVKPAGSHKTYQSAIDANQPNTRHYSRGWELLIGRKWALSFLVVGVIGITLVALSGAAALWVQTIFVIGCGIWGLTSLWRKQFLTVMGIAFPIIGAYALSMARLPFVSFYRHFGVTPEQAGWSSSEILISTAPSLVMPTLVGAICISASFGAYNAGRRLSMHYVPLLAVTAVATLVGIGFASHLYHSTHRDIEQRGEIAWTQMLTTGGVPKEMPGLVSVVKTTPGDCYWWVLPNFHQTRAYFALTFNNDVMSVDGATLPGTLHYLPDQKNVSLQSDISVASCLSRNQVSSHS